MNRQIHIVGANLIEKDGKFLLIQEGKLVKGVTGKWNFPAGKMDLNEKIIDCAKREGLEESGFSIEPEYLIGAYQHFDNRDGVDYDVMVFVFKSDIVSGKLAQHNDEIMDLKWLTKEEIENKFNKGELRRPFVYHAIEKYLNGEKYSLKLLN